MKDKIRILAVDDDPDLRALMHEALGNTYDVSTIEVADDIEESVEDFDPDLVILDVVMPGDDGIKACRRLHSNAKYIGLPVLFLSAVSEQKHLWKGISAGAAGWLAKPFNAGKLRRKVRELLENAGNFYRSTA